MQRPRERGEDWFTATYAAHYPHVVKYGLRRLADRDASVELAQEVFVIAWRRRADVPDRSLPWLYGVARRVLANQWRARRNAPETVPITDSEQLEHGGPTDQDTSVEIADVRAALARLSDLDQEVLQLVGWEELTIAEAAIVLGCSRSTTAVRLHRARRRLAAALAIPPLHIAPNPTAARQ